MESWRRATEKEADGLKSETTTDRWRKRDDKIEDSSWKRREPERRDTDKWRRNDDPDRWKKDADKWRKDDNTFDRERDDLKDRDKLDGRGFDKKDDRDRERDRDRGIDGRGVSIYFSCTVYCFIIIYYIVVE